MTKDVIEAFAAELREYYEGSVETVDAGVRHVRLPNVRFPNGCRPLESEALVALDTKQDSPSLLLKALPTLPNGRAPRSTSEVHACGKGWYQFSFNLNWDSAVHSAAQFVEGRLRRFALDE